MLHLLFISKTKIDMVKNVTIDKDVKIKVFYIPSNYNKTIFEYNPEIDKYKEVGEQVRLVITITQISTDEIKINITTKFDEVQALPYINFIKLENEFNLVNRYNIAVTTRNKEIIDIVNSKVNLILFIYLNY